MELHLKIALVVEPKKKSLKIIQDLGRPNSVEHSVFSVVLFQVIPFSLQGRIQEDNHSYR